MTRTILILVLFVFVAVSVVPGTIGQASECKKCSKTINENVLHVSKAVTDLHKANQELKTALDRANTRLDALSNCPKPDPLKNVALNRPAYQSSIYGGMQVLGAGSAVDGNSNSILSGHSCTCTNEDQFAWWMVDLGRNYTIDHVKITNRGDCCGERLADFDVLLAYTLEDAQQNKNIQTCVYHRWSVRQGATESLVCNTRLSARFVKIQLRGKNFLALCEVQVYA